MSKEKETYCNVSKVDFRYAQRWSAQRGPSAGLFRVGYGGVRIRDKRCLPKHVVEHAHNHVKKVHKETDFQKYDEPKKAEEELYILKRDLKQALQKTIEVNEEEL